MFVSMFNIHEIFGKNCICIYIYIADGWMDGWMDGGTDGRTDGRMDGWMDIPSTTIVQFCIC